MKKLITLLIAAALYLAGSSSTYAQLKDLHFGRYRITQISPNSFRSVDGTISIECFNKGGRFKMSSITGTVYKNGRAFIAGRANPMVIPSGNSTVSVHGNASLCDGITLWDVLACISFRAEDYTIDVSMTITLADGSSRIYSKKDMNVANLLNNIRGK